MSLGEKKLLSIPKDSTHFTVTIGDRTIKNIPYNCYLRYFYSQDDDEGILYIETHVYFRGKGEFKIEYLKHPEDSQPCCRACQ